MPLGGNVTSVGVQRQEPHNITYASALCTRHFMPRQLQYSSREVGQSHNRTCAAYAPTYSRFCI